MLSLFDARTQMPLGMFVDLLSRCIGTAQRGTTFWLVGSTLKSGDLAQVPLNPAVIPLVRLATGGSCDLGNLGWTILALTRTAQGHCYLADLGGFVPVHTLYRAGYNRCGPWIPPPPVCVAAYLSLWEHQEAKGEEGWGQLREAGCGTTGIDSESVPVN